mgnify:FL=1|tara:strand:- start:319 stop:783 length:465 start_codon:yes stop_codon:yes gene_type:complete
MKHEAIIDCPKSGGDLCYKVQVTPDITNYNSLSCGFWTNSLMKLNEEFYEKQMSTLPELYIDLAWEDPKTGLVWIPNTINEPGVGMIFANGTDKNNWGWAAVKAVKVSEEDKEKYPIPGKEGEFMEYRMDMDNMRLFPEREYIDALSHIGIIPE